jgi:hypothetical protein
MPVILNSEPFDERLKQLNYREVPYAERDAAITAYERLLTARAICRSIFGEEYQESSLTSIFMALDNLARANAFARHE